MILPKLQSRLALVAAVTTACFAAALAPGATEPTIIPTVHPTLLPASAIQVPLRFSADQTSVWRADVEQRMLLTGHVQITVGYRLLKADSAAVWLTPSRESGANTFDVAIYLSGSVQVREGNAANSTTTVGKELLVTTRISQNVQLEGNPISRSEQDSLIVKRGDEIRNDILNHPLAPLHFPRITITTAEDALQAGWIAKGENNRIIPGPGDIQLARDDNGNLITVPPASTRPARPRPDLLALGNTRFAQLQNESVVILEPFTDTPNPDVYILYDAHNGRPPVEFRAQRVVFFGPRDMGSQPAGSQPAGTASAPAQATAPGAAAAGSATAASTATRPGTRPSAGMEEALKYVTGAYLEGDVTVDQGDQITLRAERVYVDLATMRAVMLDATLSTIDEKRDVPIYMRAAEIRMLSRSEFAAKKATFSTSEFYTPHYHIGASEVYLRDITPQLAGPNGGQEPSGPFDVGTGDVSAKTFQFEVKDATMNIGGMPIFLWPYLAGDTSKNEIPLRTVRVSNSRTYGLSLLTDWDLFGLMGQAEPQGVRADLNLDYFGKRGPAGGVQSAWETDEDKGLLRSYIMLDQGTDRLGTDREDLLPLEKTRGRITARDQRDLGDGLTLQLEGSYISDPNFLEQFFQREFDTDKEHETSLYLKKVGQTDAFTFLGKFNLMDFTSTADQVDDQFTTEKRPEVKYWRIGDNLFDLFTYYSESGIADVHTDITNYTPAQMGLQPGFLGLPAAVVALEKDPALQQTFRDYYKAQGWTTGDVLRGDTRHELDMPLQVGDAKVTPYVTGRVTAWDDAFPEGNGSSTTRVTAGAGIRSSMQFWKVYEDANSTFFDVHRLRHVIEPQFNLFAVASDQDRRDLQPFDRSVEGISGASGTQLSINQKWQTQRGGEGHWRNVDWITLNVSWNQFWNRDKTDTGTLFYPMSPVRGYYFMSRPELSLVQNSINVDGTWRLGERVRVLGETDFSLETHRFETASAGMAIDQTNNLSYFIGNRYVRALDTDEWTFALDYQLTKKYQLIAAESFDTRQSRNILTSVTLVRRLPRANVALTVTYDANNADTSVVFTAWPEGFPASGAANQTGQGR